MPGPRRGSAGRPRSRGTSPPRRRAAPSWGTPCASRSGSPHRRARTSGPTRRRSGRRGTHRAAARSAPAARSRSSRSTRCSPSRPVRASRSPTPRRRGTRTTGVVVVNPSGPHHRDRCRTSVNASNSSSRGASMSREMTISRSAVADCAGAPLVPSRSSALLLPCLLEVLHVCVQPVESLRSRTARTRRSTRGPAAARGRQRHTGAACLPCGPAPARPPGAPAGVWTRAAGSSPAPGPARSPAAHPPAAAPGSPGAAARRSR